MDGTTGDVEVLNVAGGLVLDGHPVSEGAVSVGVVHQVPFQEDVSWGQLGNGEVPERDVGG